MTEEKIISDGALPDTRPEIERVRDYSADEVPAAGAPVTFQHDKIKALAGTVYSQEYTSSCVPHGFYTQLEYEGIVPKSGMSQLRAYRKRGNYPAAGSNAVDLYTKIRNGQSPNADAPVTKKMREDAANALPYIEGVKILKDFNYFDYRDYSLVPADVAAGKAIAIFIYATEEEWSQEYVEIKDPNLSIYDAYVKHCVCIVPNGDFTEGGKRWLTVHDSAAFGGRHLRYVSFDNFFLKRCYYASKVYPKGEIPVPPAPTPAKPTTPCELGDRSDAVKTLQAFLIEGKYLEPQYLTGYYGALTAKAVLWWQLERWNKFSSNVPALLEWAGKYWGSQSIKIINES